MPELTAPKPIPSTLETIVRHSSSRSPADQLSRLDRLMNARSLVTAVLQFVDTPWLSLKQPWTSKDILFFRKCQIDNLDYSSIPLEPYIDVAIQDPREDEKRTFHFSDLAANPALFNIAIILIELAFNASFEELVDADRAKHSQSSEVSKFLVAKRLADLVSREMGGKYSRVVKKCLYCHFASGSDLSDYKLQQEYYENVVEELQGLEKSFQELEVTEQL